MMEKASMDAVISAREIGWKALFGDTPMPTPQPDTVKAAGLLGRELQITDEAIEEGLADLEQ